MRGVELFDGHLLGVADAEGALMDPQQRLLLETVSELWATAREEKGGWAGAEARANTGVFVGVSSTDYSTLVQKHVSGVSAFMGTGARAMHARRENAPSALLSCVVLCPPPKP